MGVHLVHNNECAIANTALNTLQRAQTFYSLVGNHLFDLQKKSMEEYVQTLLETDPRCILWQ